MDSALLCSRFEDIKVVTRRRPIRDKSTLPIWTPKAPRRGAFVGVSNPVDIDFQALPLYGSRDSSAFGARWQPGVL